VTEVIRLHPETLFVIRAHPDELRPGTKKQSNESVQDWIHSRGIHEWPNVVFIGPVEYLSSYELIQEAKFAIVYNSSIGLEAALMGVPVLCGGKARYTQYPTVFFPQSPEAFRRQAEEFLEADSITIPPEFQRNARHFLYYQLYKTSLPFDALLTQDLTPGFVRLRRGVSWQDFTPTSSPTMYALVDGLLHGGDFLLTNEEPGRQ